MKIITASDFHICDDSNFNKIYEFYRIIKSSKPDKLILLGDIADPWKAKWEEILETKSWKLLKKL
jgi:UDP-2,3-diacylglucosamine pyrophosphatase LpxH